MRKAAAFKFGCSAKPSVITGTLYRQLRADS